VVIAIVEEVPVQILLVQALADNQDRAARRVVQAGGDHVRERVDHELALLFRPGVLGRKGVVDDDDVGAPPG